MNTTEATAIGHLQSAVIPDLDIEIAPGGCIEPVLHAPLVIGIIINLVLV